MCGPLNALLYRWLRYALDLYASVLLGYINLPLLPCPSFQTSPTAHILVCPRGTTGRSKSPSTSSTHTTTATRSAIAITNRKPAHPHNCERRCGYHPIRSHLTTVVALFAFVIVQPQTPYTHHRPPARYLLVTETWGRNECYGRLCDGIHYYRPDSCPFSLYCLCTCVCFLAYGRSIPPSCYRVARERGHDWTLQPPPRVMLFRAHSQRRPG